MAFRLFLPLVIIFFAFLYAAVFNPGEVVFRYAPGSSVKIPIVALIMASFLAGVLSLSLVQFFRLVGEGINNFSNMLKRVAASRLESAFVKANRTALDGDLEKAEKLLDRILGRKPGHVEALMLKGDICRKTGRFDEAIRAHSHALSERPSDLEIIAQIAEDYLAGGNPAGALRIFDKIASRTSPTVELLSKQRDVCIQLGDISRARLLQNGVLSLVMDEAGRKAGQEKMAQILCLLGEQFLADGKQDEALTSFENAVEVRPDFVPARMLLGDALVRKGRTGEAEDCFRRVFLETGSAAPLIRLEKHGLGGEGLRRWAGEVLPSAVTGSSWTNPKYKCRSCGLSEADYYPQCPSCGAWNALSTK